MNASKLKNLPLSHRNKWAGLTDEEKAEAIKEDEESITPKQHADITAFVQEQLKKGIKPRQIKKMVKKKFKVILI